MTQHIVKNRVIGIPKPIWTISESGTTGKWQWIQRKDGSGCLYAERDNSLLGTLKPLHYG
jgi:hypothetical protein